ncbi:sensor histidine kinase [Clostridium felsineum]|uniref:histidine kinase n=1 Tax=Clostridium felsineum TaxID=36839 RepID=A0A1S8LQ37_9CLOT|nr:sensor histidine kinase [Clostridium felsineum]URZ04761.1 Adaptive-response sensory-kinase SasA [Clostridium felsineum]URZ09802.1 Adaptive-response sensory-kinase SasA [Clostridium felsineum]
MIFLKYLRDNLRFIALYIFIGIFVVLFMYLERENIMSSTDAAYVIFVITFLLVIFIFIDFNIKNKYIKRLLIDNNVEDKTPIFPKPLEYKDEVYAAIIEDLYKDYSQKLEALQKEFENNNEFMTMWVHEIKTPIATSKLLIENGEINIESFEEEIEKIDDYVEKVLYYSRGDNFSKDYIISEIDINKLVKESIKNHSKLFIRKHIKLSLKVDDDFKVDTDKKWLLFILNQVIVNALKYTGNNGNIEIKSFEDDKEKIVIISDNGIGIKEEDLNKVFNKSFTGFNGRKENSNATGMGLYLSYKLARKLGHNITIKSRYTKGTEVFIHFPKWCDYYEVTKM